MKNLEMFVLFVFLSVFGMGTSELPTVPCIRHLESVNYDVVAQAARLQGEVPVEVTLGDDGKVADVRVLPTQSDKLLQKQALDNIRQWTFAPTGKQKFTITYEFRLVAPEVSGWSPSTTTIDFPSHVKVTCNLAPIYKD